MRITTFHPSFRANNEGTPISPETLAAVLAKYSREGGGLQRILEKLISMPTEDFDRTVWRAFDYGHASIGGLTGGIPVGIDNVPMILPYLTFFLQPKQDGQETSTRYVEFKPEGLAHPESFGIPEEFHGEWQRIMLTGFDITKQLTEQLDTLAKQQPETTRIPADLPEKVRNRMIKNFGLDRARYTLPLASLTNFGQIATARDWAQTIQYLDSFDLPCSRQLAGEIRNGITSVNPRLTKHTQPTERTRQFANDFLDRAVAYLQANEINTEKAKDELQVTIHQPPRSPFVHPELSDEELMNLGFNGKQTRYDFAKGSAEKTFVSIAWNNVAIAEARDINRHRTSKKDTLLAPVGFYMPEISVEQMRKNGGQLYEQYQRFVQDRATLMRNILQSRNPRSYVGCLLLGDQTPFELHTTLDQLAYITELRTGIGAHFRYDDHFRQVHREMARQRPDLAKHIKLGTGEPE